MKTIYIYLYRVQGVPVYVGQAVNVARRHYGHLRGNSPFEKFLRGNETTLEIVDSVQDVPHGQFANQQEDAAMDQYGTYFPETGRGYNFIRAGQLGDWTEQQRRAHSASVSASNKRRFLGPEFSSKMRKIASRPRKWTDGPHPSMARPDRKPMLGKKHTAKAIAKMRAASKGQIPWNKGITGYHRKRKAAL